MRVQLWTAVSTVDEQGLSPSITQRLKKILNQCAEEARAKIHSETQAADLKAMEDLAKAGMEVYQVPASEVALWQEATKQVREDFIKNNPKLGKTLVDQCLAANK